MTITNVNIHNIFTEGKLKAVDGGFADMVHPIFAGAREIIEVPVLNAYAAYVAQMTE